MIEELIELNTRLVEILSSGKVKPVEGFSAEDIQAQLTLAQDFLKAHGV